MIDPGQLKTRLTIEAPVEAPDGQGGVVRTFAPFATVWAALTPLPGREVVSADADGADVRYRIVLRSNVSLTLQHRLVDGVRVFRIAAIRDRDDRRLIEIDAVLRVE